MFRAQCNTSQKTPEATPYTRSLALLWAEEKEWTLCLGAWEGFTVTAILAAQLLTLLSEPLLGGPHCTLWTSKGQVSGF